MDKETANYIITYYSSLLTENESAALRHSRHILKLDNDDNDEDSERRYRILMKAGWITEDEDILKFLKDGYDVFEYCTASRILKESSDKVFLNNCAVCGKLARTPYAKQCRYCGHDWHEMK